MTIGKWEIFAREMALETVRNNTILEDIHAGKRLPKKYMKGYSRITEEEMRQLMLKVEKNISHFLYTLIERDKYNNKQWLETIKRAWFGRLGISWDNPTLNKE